MGRNQQNSANGRLLEGQALPFVALLIASMIAICGLTVDGGLALVHRRTSTLLSDTLAIDATRTMLDQRSSGDNDQAIVRTIEQGIAWQEQLDASKLTWQAWYVDASLVGIRALEDGNRRIPANARGIRVDIAYTMPTVFMRLLGQSTLTTETSASAFIGSLGTTIGSDVLPLGLSQRTADVLRTSTGPVDMNMLNSAFPYSNTIQLGERYVVALQPDTKWRDGDSCDTGAAKNTSWWCAGASVPLNIGDALEIGQVHAGQVKAIDWRMQHQPKGVAPVCVIIRVEDRDVCNIRGFVGIELVDWDVRKQVLILRYLDPIAAPGSITGSGNGVNFGAYAINLVE